MSDKTFIAQLLERERWLSLLLLLGVTVWSWYFLLGGAGMDMGGMMGMGEMSPNAFSTDYLVMLFWMWWVMMIAMMLPTAAPMVLSYQTLVSRSSDASHLTLKTIIMVFGYLLMWAIFSLLAVLLHAWLETEGLVSPMMTSTNKTLDAALLILAGVYQLTPLKDACLKHCQSPLHYLASHWKNGVGGAFLIGLRHGTYCLGCCWVLMALLFYGGVMNVYWIAGLALYVLVEKLTLLGHYTSKIIGYALIAFGIYSLTI